MFSCQFCKISRNNFFIEHIRATAFGLSFVSQQKEQVCEGTSLVKFLQYHYFNIKWRKDLLKRKDQKQPPEVLY